MRPPRNGIVGALIGAAYAAILVFAFLALLHLAGCASGVQMDDDEAKACRTSGCTVWTEAELRNLAQTWFKQGYRHGWKHANEEAGRGL